VSEHPTQTQSAPRRSEQEALVTLPTRAGQPFQAVESPLAIRVGWPPPNGTVSMTSSDLAKSAVEAGRKRRLHRSLGEEQLTAVAAAYADVTPLAVL
jgi:hypothetical protein